jgi:hypothetical protein
VVTFAAAAADEASVWWVWALAGLVVWLAVASVVGVVIGRGIRRADLREPDDRAAVPLTLAALDPTPQRADAPARRRALPIPTFGLALFGIAVALETVGYIVRLSGNETSAGAFSMDAPFSLPRLFVAAMFAAAGLAAVAGAGAFAGRRTWWLAVGVVAGGIAAVKASSTVHSDVLTVLNDAVGAGAGLTMSVLAAAAVVGVLWFLSRDERRDRRRVLGALALYAVAAVGLSAVSSAVAGSAGFASTWAAGATFLEESGEALAAVAFLIGVLAGVAPRLVLPSAWVLRREVDAQTLDLPELTPGRTPQDRTVR